jgi:transposase
MLFMTLLCRKLDQDRPDWRETTIIIMDNASYNKTDDCIRHYNSLRIPMIFSGPYSFDASPVEKVFAYFK